MYSLLTNYRSSQKFPNKIIDDEYPYLNMSLETSQNIFNFTSKNFFFHPLIWSTKEKKLISNTKIQLQAGDFIIISNSGFMNFYQDENKIKELFSRIFKFFAEEGLQTCVNMLQKELCFATKKKNIENDIHILCLQILY